MTVALRVAITELILDLTFIVCPLCGKMTSLKTFKPTRLDLDIYVQDVQGLGRGRGFKVVDRKSALRIPSITQPVKERLLDLAVMLNEKGLLPEEEVAERFGLPLENHQALVVERGALKANLNEAEGQLKEVEEERDTARAELEEANEAFSDKMNKFIHLVSDALDEDPEDWGVEEEGGVFATLKFGMERLIEAYQALKASEEEEV